jgi:hypothetical protein
MAMLRQIQAPGMRGALRRRLGAPQALAIARPLRARATAGRRGPIALRAAMPEAPAAEVRTDSFRKCLQDCRRQPRRKRQTRTRETPAAAQRVPRPPSLPAFPGACNTVLLPAGQYMPCMESKHTVNPS